MKVILLQNVKGVGKTGDVKEISDGYARNFLIPKKMAELATESGIQKVEALRKKQEAENRAAIEKSKKIAETLKNLKIEIQAKEKGGKLFGSITAKEILDELDKKGFQVDLGSIDLKSPIKKIGEYEIPVNFGNNIKSDFKLLVKGK